MFLGQEEPTITFIYNCTE